MACRVKQSHMRYKMETMYSKKNTAGKVSKNDGINNLKT